MSSPRIVTADQTKAMIEQGTEFPYQQATSSGATAVAFRRATLKLEVTPQITPEGNIILDLDINKDSRGETTAAGIAINTKHIKTQVLVENGGTVVIGGIFELTETENETKVPLLGDLPGVGNLFKNKSAHFQQAGNAGLHHAEDDRGPRRRTLIPISPIHSRVPPCAFCPIS